MKQNNDKNLYAHIKETISNNKDGIIKGVLDQSNSFMDVNVYYTIFFNTLASKLTFSDISKTALLANLDKDKWTLIQQFTRVKNKQSRTCDENKEIQNALETIFEGNKNVYVKDSYTIIMHSSGSEDENNADACEVYAYYDSANPSGKDYLKKMITSCAVEEKIDSSFYLLTKNSFGELDLKKYNAKVPPNIDLNLNYGKTFNEANEVILKKLNEKTHGLYVLHGAPGTGKSTYIKWLATNVRKKFIYVPEFMVPAINDPATMQLFLENSNSVVILEDAEKLITKRDESPQSMASLILNITDGILADIMKLSVIITYNTGSENVDQALLRKGRLQYIYEFKLLCKDDVVALVKSHGMKQKQIDGLLDKKQIKDQMSLADIYNIYDQTGFAPAKKESSLGFGF